MSLLTLDLARWNRRSIGFGLAIWIVILLARLLDWIAIDELQLLLLLALSVITPLAIPLVKLPTEKNSPSNLMHWIIFLQPFATTSGEVSLLADRGWWAGGTACLWLLFTLLIALRGTMMLLQKSGRQLVAVSLAVSLIYVPIGGIWLVLDRFSLRPLGFSPTTVLLTATHFHFIALAALLIIGLTGQAIQTKQSSITWKIYRVLASCMLINPLLVALGIIMTQVTGIHWLETASAILLALCLILIAWFNLYFIIPGTTPLLARGLLIVSSTSIIFTMIFAGAYALGNQTDIWHITVSQMILVHGWINALVFGLCGLLGWRLSYTPGKE